MFSLKLAIHINPLMHYAVILEQSSPKLYAMWHVSQRVPKTTMNCTVQF